MHDIYKTYQVLKIGQENNEKGDCSCKRKNKSVPHHIMKYSIES